MTSNLGINPVVSLAGRPAVGAVPGTAALLLLGVVIASVASSFLPRGAGSGGPPDLRVDAAATSHHSAAPSNHAAAPSNHAAAPSNAPPLSPRHASAAPRSDQIGALARVLSDRYRVSPEGLRPLLVTAYTEGERHAVDPLLVIAVMAVESRFNPIAESAAGAMGLMQVIPRMHVEKIAAASGRSVLDPATNIRVGVQVLKEYIERGGSLVAGLQLYNGSAGDGTSAYATKVLGEKRRLQEAARGFTGRAVSRES